MKLIDWVTRRQRDASPVRGELVTIMDRADSLTSKVSENAAKQLQVSVFPTVNQRDSLVMQRVLGQQPVKGAR